MINVVSVQKKQKQLNIYFGHVIKYLNFGLNNWIFEKTEIELQLNLTIILFGITDKSKKNYTRNLITLLTKFYIYRTKSNTEQVHLKALQNYLIENLVIEKNIYYKNKSYEKANTCWSPWASIL